MTTPTPRRRWLAQGLGAALWASLASLARAGEALAQGDARAAWRHLGRLCAEAHDGALAATAWQDAVEDALRAVSLPSLVASLPGARLAAAARAAPPRGARAEGLGAWAGATAREAMAARRRLFTLGAGRAVVPHGHVSVASVFVVLRGEVRATHYDRRPGPPGRSLLTPTIDRALAPGAFTTVSDARDNVHWMRAGEAGALLLNVSVETPTSGRFGDAPRGRVYLDPTGDGRDGGAIVAPHLSLAEATARFG